ncbi:MAG: O-antigen ligase family protein [Pyrinomonadaceae bacterium]|nr:O-antigen ligase family protein [Pyrinomonadaceae bacterium]
MAEATPNTLLLFRRSAWAAAVLLIIFAATMKPFLFVAGQRSSPPDILFPAAFGLMLAAVAARQLRLRFDPAFVCFAAYFAAMLISSIFSVDPRTSYLRLAGELYLIGLAALIIVQLDSESRLRHTVYAWLTGTSIAVVIAFISAALYFLSPDNWLLSHTLYTFGAVPAVNFPRISSTMVSASMFCNFLTVSVAFSFLAKEKRWIGKLMFGCLIAAIVLAALSTISIGIGGIALVTCICVYLTEYSNRPRLAKATLAAGITAAAMFWMLSFAALKPHSTSPFSISLPIVGSVQPSSRTLVWISSLKTFANDPLTGKGLGQPACAVSFENTDGSYSMLTDAHNIYLSVGAQNGILGVAALIALCFYFWRIGRRSGDIGVKLIWAAFVSAFLYQGMVGAYEDARHLWVLIGILAAASKLRGGTEQGLAHGTGIRPA